MRKFTCNRALIIIIINIIIIFTIIITRWVRNRWYLIFILKSHEAKVGHFLLFLFFFIFGGVIPSSFKGLLPILCSINLEFDFGALTSDVTRFLTFIASNFFSFLLTFSFILLVKVYCSWAILFSQELLEFYSEHGNISIFITRIFKVFFFTIIL